MNRKLAFWTRKFQRYSDRRWYLPLLATVVGLDLFFLVVPSDGLLVSSVMLRPKRWMRICLWVSVGSSLGALALAALVQWDSIWLMDVFPGLFQSSQWESTNAFIDQHGAWALALFSFSILPQQPAVVISALAGMPLELILASVLVGRFVKYAILSYVASHAPRLIYRLWFVRKEVQQIQESKL
ncbi:MAG: hypothetical protein KDD51_09750 [Bdellovibrionales bacterium]|nr:hypothetical protein [Bdellovibrionales bacterium]